MNDSELLDFLDELHARSGFALCVLRRSTTGRGWRLHSLPPSEERQLGVSGHTTARRAIEAFAERERQKDT
jgi:hypothetical protein